MNEELNKQELNRLAQIGAKDISEQVDPKSIATTIAASVLYCSSAVITSITAVVDVTLAASYLFSCANNPAQCG
ncbi:hypothetical protein H9660_15960 [Clostridium sp. Sa3CUN1]|uniref:Type 2 lantibiotic, SP_1948 family n=1 Tax=Clostridium gallinarum TaxID=2762246 RepID=A0ABR8Q856_9CLOT|nr:hypothetical protein [Clostridium gallinarum]MBD7916624.1 hypothetical protein [Clostridium gallinarum]